jgi:type I restriction enzyme, S subunit
MITGLKPYPTYKNSDLSWLGEVPAAWNVLRGRHLFDIKKRIAREVGHPVLSVTQAGLRVKDVHSGEGQVSQDYSKYQIVKPGEFVMNSMDLLTGGVGIADSVGVTSPDYRVFAIRDGGQCRDRYVLHVFRTLYENRGFYAWGQGSAQLGRWRLPRKRFNEFPFPVPSLREQAAIVRFLDHADRRIRRYIRTKQKLIKLLEEQKQAIIHRAVTRGLDSNVRLKPSGVEWLGDVPEHWEVARLKDAADVQTGLTLGKNYKGVATESRPYLRVANVQVGRVDLRRVKHIDVPPHEASGATLQDGDVLMTEGGDIDKLGRGCVWRDEVPGCLHQNHIFAVRCRQHLLVPEFLAGLMASQHGRNYFQLTAKQTTNLASTNSTTLRAFPIVLPPLAEQKAILDNILKQSIGLDAAIDRTLREISLLREYRTRLIADVVTGKLDVREAAAKLPDETSAPGSLDAETPIEGDEETEASNLNDVPEEAEA